MTIKNKDIRPLMEVNAIIMNDKEVKSKLPKSLINVLSAQKNIKTLGGKEKEINDLLEIAKRELANKDEKDVPIIIEDPKSISPNNPKGKVYDIPEEKMVELNVTYNHLMDTEIDVTLSVFSMEAGEIIVPFLNGEQTWAFTTYLLEQPEEEVTVEGPEEIKEMKLEPTH